MDKIIYALVIMDTCDCPNYEFIKINKTEKEKLIKFCKMTKDIKVYNDYYTIIAWCDNVGIEDNDEIEIITGNVLCQRIISTIKRLDQMRESHYLYRYNVRDKFVELSEFTWDDIE